jgi:hypothetical protein
MVKPNGLRAVKGAHSLGHPNKRMVHPDGLRAMKGIHSLGQEVEGTKDYGWNYCMSYKKNYKRLFYEYYDVKIVHVYQHGVVH